MDLVCAMFPDEVISVLQKVHEISQQDQFQMKLLCEFEYVRLNLMSQDPSPSLDMCLSELLTT